MTTTGVSLCKYKTVDTIRQSSDMYDMQNRVFHVDPRLLGYSLSLKKVWTLSLIHI